MTKSEKLKALRVEQGLSQAEAAKLVRIAQRSWARYESGDRTPPDGVLELFCIKTGLSFDEHFARSPDGQS